MLLAVRGMIADMVRLSSIGPGLIVAFSLLFLAFSAAACGSQAAFDPRTVEGTPTARFSPTPLPPTFTAVVFQLRPSSTPIPTSTPPGVDLTVGYGPTGFPADVNPLTGLRVENPALLERRPMAIKVTNFPRRVRPQWGLSLADHVIEYYLEDGMSRFIGIFYSQDAERVGPVRSGRFFDEHVMRMYEATLTFGYADRRVIDAWMESDIKNRLVIERPGNCPPMCRIGSERDYNNLFTGTAALSQYITARGTNNTRQKLDGLRFDNGYPYFSYQVGEQLLVYYSSVSYSRWDYTKGSNRYLRFQDVHDADDRGMEFLPLTDSLTYQQLAADNLVVLFVPHIQLPDTSDTEIYRITFTGVGEGLAFREGKVMPIVWERPADDSMVSLKVDGGGLYSLRPGNVWFEIMGVSSRSSQAEDGTWRLDFSVP